MKSPGCVKDVQRLAGRLTSLSRFLGASATKALPFFNLMKKGMAFEWTPACEEAFQHFKEILAAPPVLGKPRDGEPLYLYLAITSEALAAVLVREDGRTQQPVYFISRALQGAELRYSKLEKLALALLTSSRRLKQYFQSHQVVVRTDQGIRQVLQKPDLAERMMTWSIELSQYDIRYEPRRAIKAQAMADFLVEVTGDPGEDLGTRWKLHVDGASNQTFGGAGIILESPNGVVYEQSVRFEFFISNNQAEYEALIGGLALATEVGAKRLEVCSDSQVITSQVNGSYQAKDPLLQKYLEKVITRFGIPEVVISDNGTQFADKKFTEFLNGLVIPVEIGEPSPRLLLKGVEETVEKDLIDEAREMAHLTETALKQRIALRYNTKVLKRDFEPGDLVLRRNDIGLPTPGEVTE
ncbi:uncharacterized protein LOC130975837 [Arachis stenosperma]|uniref:uncharacterized protein LOC130975837 n=1 Tax=Arachis stenosperma TaxID=217475 RepID=UPI0025AD2DCA|nr:uncharacterized protein LOC130975837 [Arachis stenosperma]